MFCVEMLGEHDNKVKHLIIRGKEQGEVAVFTDYLRYTQLEDLLRGTIFEASGI